MPIFHPGKPDVLISETVVFGGQQAIFSLDRVCIESILFRVDSLSGIKTINRSFVYRMIRTL